jgi:hypothetical protein
MHTTRANTILFSCLTLLALLPFNPAYAADWSYSSDGLTGSLWALTDQSLDSEPYVREEVGFYGGKMYWRSTSSYVFDEIHGFSITGPGIKGDRRYCGFLINPKSLIGPNLYVVWGRVNIMEQALTMKAIGIAGIVPDFVRLHPAFNRKITFHRIFESGWFPPLASPPILQHWKSVTPVGTFDGGVLWTLGIDNSTGKRIIAGIADPEDARYFLPEPVVTLPLNENHEVRGIAADGDFIWYTEFHSESIYQFTKTGEPVASFLAPGDPSGIFVKDGTIWYVARQARSINKCDMNGSCYTAITLPFYNPYGIAFDGTYFWVTESLYGRMLYKIDMDGNIVSFIYPPTGGKTGNGPLTNPYSIALSGSNLWLFGIGGKPGSFGWDLYKLDIADLQKNPVMTNE